jgi:hypothetical protein
VKNLPIISATLFGVVSLALGNSVNARTVITPVDNGNLSVTGMMPGRGCTVLFNREGKRLQQGGSCNATEIKKAQEAVNGYIREQSTSDHHNSHSTETPENLYSKVPPALKDLVGARAGRAEGDLLRRGYTYRNTVTFDGGKSAYYIENRTGYCVEVGTTDGRYSSIVYNSSDRCQASN